MDDLELDFEPAEFEDDLDFDTEGEDDVDLLDDALDREEEAEETESPELLPGLIFHGVSHLMGRNRTKTFASPRATGGVSSARLNTPNGSARLRLSKPAVSVATFNRSMRVVNGRLNSLSKDVSRVRSGLARTNKEARRVSRQTRRAVAATNKRVDRRLERANMNNMFMTMMMQQQTQRRIAALHNIPMPQNTMMGMMLPMMMMMGSGKGSSGGNMMMPMMMMMAMGGFMK